MTGVDVERMTVPSRALPMMVEHLASRADYHKGDTIYHQAGPAEYGYRIVTGAARECALMADGRRQVVGFLLPGDVFGFWTRGAHRFSGEIITEATTVARYPRRRIEKLVESEPKVAREVHQLALEAIDRLQMRMELLAKISALERVSGFLLQMAERSAADGDSRIALPMSRYDIADYLALAVETVSRTLTSLRSRGVILFTGTRSCRIVDHRLLEWCSEHRDL
ncbi:MAG: helix-turn-helix domain-containing protein [Steroidobacteraceae bacterium]